MKNLITLFIFLISLSFSGFAQQVKSTKDTPSYSKLPVYPIKKISPPPVYNNAVKKPAYSTRLNKDTSSYSKLPLFIFKLYSDDKEYTAIPFLSLVDQKDIANMEILKNKADDDEYGPSGKNGIIIITLARDVEIHQLKELLIKNNIKPKLRNLPIYVDSTLTPGKPDMFYTSAKIKSVSVEKEKGTGMKYISIITTTGANRNIRGTDFRIRGTTTEEKNG